MLIYEIYPTQIVAVMNTSAIDLSNLIIIDMAKTGQSVLGADPPCVLAKYSNTIGDESNMINVRGTNKKLIDRLVYNVSNDCKA